MFVSLWYAFSGVFEGPSSPKIPQSASDGPDRILDDLSVLGAMDVGYWGFAGAEWHIQQTVGKRESLFDFDIEIDVELPPADPHADRQFLEALEALGTNEQELADGVVRFDSSLPPAEFSVFTRDIGNGPVILGASAGLHQQGTNAWNIWRLRRAKTAEQTDRILTQFPDSWEPALVRSDSSGQRIAELYVGCWLTKEVLQELDARAVSSGVEAPGLEGLYLLDRAGGQVAIRFIAATKGVFLVARIPTE